MEDYPKIRYPEDCTGLFADGRVYIQEKIDGSNGRFTLESNIEDGYKTESRDLVFGSRNYTYKNQKDEAKSFRDTIEYVRETIDMNILRGYDEKYGGLVLFGEYMVPNVLKEEYNWDTWRDKFVGFDVWSISRQEFLNPEKSVEIFDTVGLPYSKIIDSYTVSEWESGKTEFHNESGEWMSGNEWCPITEFGDGLAEGIVIKNPTTQTYAKMVRDDFREKHSTGDMQYEKSDAKKLSYQYITDARIEKVARKMVKEGEYDSLTMDMMQDLPVAVIEDMAEEEAQNIFMYENWNIDLSEFRKVTSKRCSQILKRLINIESSL